MVCFQEVIHAEIACGQQLWLQGSVQLPWRSRVNSHQVQCNNIPTFRPYFKKNVHLFLERCKKSNNVWLHALMQSGCLYWYLSLFFEHYNRILLCD